MVMEKNGQDIGNLSLSYAKDVTSCSGSRQDFSMKLSGGSRKLPRRCKTLETLCVEMLGQHLEDIVDEVHLFSATCTPSVKASLLAIARRRGLVTDGLLVALADESWELLDVSGSDVTDAGIKKVAAVCSQLQAVDISRCHKLTPKAVRTLGQHCPAIHTLRWGGTSGSDLKARLALGYILPKLNINEEVEDSWEVLDSKPIGQGVQALRWLVWPTIDINSRASLEIECPRVIINPKPSKSVPWEARPESVLDSAAVIDIDPKIWVVPPISTPAPEKPMQRESSPELSVAERFKLAFASRDERLAPKRAKNMRQNQRRSEKAWLESDSDAKSRAWAGIARKSLK